ncbi:MAG TPA: aspartate kinase [Candidatus Didemnitutus sp.]|nr:aspartate kinase [Candidatus Didemnitutus sp.]
MLVMKFGGTSVQDATALRQVASIIHNHAAEPGGVVVVLSATSGTTNTLLSLAERAGRGEEIDADLTMLEVRHSGILSELAPQASHADLNELFHECRSYARALQILGECTPQSLDHMTAFGERLSTTILSSALRATAHSAVYFDVRTVMRTNDEFCAAQVDMYHTRSLCSQHLAPLCASGSVVITQGFLGSTSDGRTTTLGRGGSDYSAAILGAALSAREIQIWTDVSGVYSADPRFVPEAQPITELSFGEVRELALYGAKVLHPDTIAPAVEALIPVCVLNTFRPEDAGTRIVAHTPSTAAIHAVSIVRGCSLVQCSVTTAAHIRSVPELGRSIILESETVESAMIVLKNSGENGILALEVAIADSAVAIRPTSLVAVSGPHVNMPNILAEIAASISAFTIHAITTGAAAHTIFIAVEELQSNDALRAIHEIIPRHR